TRSRRPAPPPPRSLAPPSVPPGPSHPPLLEALIICLEALGKLAWVDVRPVTERDIRTSFVNCSKGEANRLAVPRDLATRPWDDLAFSGGRDPAATDRAYLVADSGDRFVAVTLRRAAPTAGRPRRGMCSLCLTTHSGDGVSLMTARKAGRGGQQGNSV